MMQEDQFQNSSCFLKKTFYELKVNGLQVSFNISRQPSTWPTIKTNCVKLQTTDPGIRSISIFQKRVWKQFLHHILCMIFQEKRFSFYILLTDQFSLPYCLYFLRYWTKSVLQLLDFQVVIHNFEVNPFSYIIKKSRQKPKYLENKKSF